MLWLWPSRERAEIENDFSTFWTLKHGFSIFWTLEHGFSTFWPRPGIWLKSRSVGDPDPPWEFGRPHSLNRRGACGAPNNYVLLLIQFPDVD